MHSRTMSSGSLPCIEVRAWCVLILPGTAFMNTYVLLLPLHIYFSISEYRKNKWNISSGNFLLICFIELILKRGRAKGLGFILFVI